MSLLFSPCIHFAAAATSPYREYLRAKHPATCSISQHRELPSAQSWAPSNPTRQTPPLHAQRPPRNTGTKRFHRPANHVKPRRKRWSTKCWGSAARPRASQHVCVLHRTSYSVVRWMDRIHSRRPHVVGELARWWPASMICRNNKRRRRTYPRGIELNVCTSQAVQSPKSSIGHPQNM
jgi:hypothetical protein